ncbi:MAG: nitrous oxide reductase accessory protein NosL [Gammaproteobacteria bacterium]|nr:nitrous oxide reductase accessory protein NosL [Gammaproteobacteria bacterium]
MQLLAAAGAIGITGNTLASDHNHGDQPMGDAMPNGKIGAMDPGQGWLTRGESCHGDGTPLQFIPKTAVDANPLENELSKYPKCPYCGMSRKMWHHSRHLVHYDDGLADGTCSVHCLAISLSLNLDRGINKVYAADFGDTQEPKALQNADTMTYLIGSQLKGTMSSVSKMAFADKAAAEAVMAKEGGKLASFNETLEASYLGMAKDTMMIRQRRKERREKMMQEKMQKGMS